MSHDLPRNYCRTGAPCTIVVRTVFLGEGMHHMLQKHNYRIIPPNCSTMKRIAANPTDEAPDAKRSPSPHSISGMLLQRLPGDIVELVWKQYFKHVMWELRSRTWVTLRSTCNVYTLQSQDKQWSFWGPVLDVECVGFFDQQCLEAKRQDQLYCVCTPAQYSNSGRTRNWWTLPSCRHGTYGNHHFIDRRNTNPDV